MSFTVLLPGVTTGGASSVVDWAPLTDITLLFQYSEFLEDPTPGQPMGRVHIYYVVM